jgi:Flp pilus assembly protein TadB
MYPLTKTNGELWKAMRKNKHQRSGFTKPWWLTLFIIMIALAAVASIICVICGQPEVASAIGSIALIVTLLVVVLYTHYTGIYAKASAFPSVSFELRSPKPDFFQF